MYCQDSKGNVQDPQALKWRQANTRARQASLDHMEVCNLRMITECAQGPDRCREKETHTICSVSALPFLQRLC